MGFLIYKEAFGVYANDLHARVAQGGATPHHLTPDVWAQIGGKWVIFGPGGREMEYCYMGVF